MLEQPVSERKRYRLLDDGRRGLPRASLVVPLLTVAVSIYPVRDQMTRGVLVAGPALVWLGALLLGWRKRSLRIVLAAATIVPAIFLALPGRPVDRDALRAEYVASLRAYEGARYVWGGETTRGIDCSGLVRCGLMDAALRLGLRTANPALIRLSISLWWHDQSANSLGDGAGGQARLVTTTSGINELDHRKIEAGDFAITDDGVHALAYLGDNEWIEAEPGVMRVIRVRVPTRDNPWFERDVQIMRWRLLE